VGNRRWAWGRGATNVKVERSQILGEYGLPDRLRRLAEMRANLQAALDPDGHPDKVMQSPLTAIPVIDEHGFVYALIYAESAKEYFALRMARGQFRGVRHRLTLSAADWELAQRRWEAGSS
jgi:hypothetical protein